MTWREKNRDRWVAIATATAFAVGLFIGQLDARGQETSEAPTEAAAPTEAVSEEAPAVDEEEPEAPVEGELSAEEPTAAEAPAETALLAPEQLDILVAPVALYPDPLLVLVLQGATFPIEVVAANRFLGKLAEQPELQPDPDWDSSIVGLLNYPDVLARMDEELDWTEALGEAVLNQLADVQASIQQVRLQAYMAGMLVTNEQQVVTGSPDLIIVLPADETQIFVPSYNPAAVLAAEPVPLAPVEAVSEEPAEPEPVQAVTEEPAEPEPVQAVTEESAEPESVEAVAEAPVEPAPETYVEPAQAPATYQGPAPLPPVYASALPVVQYSDPSPSFWTGAAVFAGGAAVGGLLGYVIGDDDDDGNDWDYNDEDWDDISDDVDNIADDMDELTEGFEDLAEQREETADQLQQRSEERADALEEGRDQRADQREAVAQNREKQKDELRDKHQKHQAQQVQDQLRQRKGLPEASADRAARQQVAALGDGSAGLAPASVKRPADAPGLAARKPSAGTRPAVQRQAGAGAVATRSPTLAKAEAAKPAPRRPGAQSVTAKPKSALTAPKPAREVKKQSLRGASSRSSAKTTAIAQGGGERAVARSDGQRRGDGVRNGGGRSRSAMASLRDGGSKVARSSSRGKASRGGGGGGRRR